MFWLWVGSFCLLLFSSKNYRKKSNNFSIFSPIADVDEQTNVWFRFLFNLDSKVILIWLRRTRTLTQCMKSEKNMCSTYVIVGIYLIVSIPIFFIVFNASQNVIDEEFHLRQGKHYCNGSFEIVSTLDNCAKCHPTEYSIPCLYFFYIAVGSKNYNFSGTVHHFHVIFASVQIMHNIGIATNIADCISCECLADLRNSENRSAEGTSSTSI